MAKKFDLGDFARSLQPVSGSDTGREQIEYIDIDRIDDDPRNFYELSDIEALAENIDLFGVLEPLRVMTSADAPGRVTIVSGHRRRAALKKLVEDGREDLRDVPCIRERDAGSPALQELRLIYANSDTRRMTSAEVARQAQRVEALLYELKEEGYEFPGRMRDHVAEACKVSASKLARLKAIQKRLIPPLAAVWEDGKLREEQAYMLSQVEPEVQRLIHVYAEAPFDQWYGWKIGAWNEAIKKIRAIRCSRLNGEPCREIPQRIEWELESHYHPKYCNECCGTCRNADSCADVCELCRDWAAQLREEKARKEAEQKACEEQRKAALEKRDAEIEQRREEARARVQTVWSRVAEAVARSSLTNREAAILLGYCEEDEWDVEGSRFNELLDGADVKPTDEDPILPFLFDQDDLDLLVDVADGLGCSLDFLLGRMDVPEMAGTGKESK